MGAWLEGEFGGGAVGGFVKSKFTCLLTKKGVQTSFFTVAACSSLLAIHMHLANL